MTEPLRKFRLGDDDVALAMRTVVFLDGEKQTDLIGWDCDEGVIERYVFDDDGSPVVYGEIDDDGEVISGSHPTPVTETLTGVVEVRWA